MGGWTRRGRARGREPQGGGATLRRAEDGVGLLKVSEVGSLGLEALGAEGGAWGLPGSFSHPRRWTGDTSTILSEP